MDAQRNKEIVRRYLQEVWCKGNVDVAEELLLPACEFHIADLGLTGSENWQTGMSMFLTEHPNCFDIEVANILADGDQVAVHWVGRGQTRTEEPIKYDVMAFYRLYDGKIAEAWVTMQELKPEPA